MKHEFLYHQALVCEYGHLITGNLSAFADSPAQHCPQCGHKCISTCPSCGAPIHGDCYMLRAVHEKCACGSVWDGSSVSRSHEPKDFAEHVVAPCTTPSYCHACGSPYPWTELLLAEAGRIVDLIDELTVEQKLLLKDCFPSLISEMPSTPANALIAAKLLQSVSAIAKTALQNLLADRLTAFVLSLLGWKSQ